MWSGHQPRALGQGSGGLWFVEQGQWQMETKESQEEDLRGEA